MSCGCDKKPLKPKTPSPVLEIKNEECPILFHTVELEGSSQDNPPYIGQYRNVLLVYKGDDTRYLFSSDGIPTSLAGGNSGAQEFNNILNRPKYANETMTSSTNIPDVTEAVEAEATARAEADRGIQEEVGRETELRVNADTALDQKIDQEVATINGVTQALSGSISTLDNAINRDVVTDITAPTTPSTTSVEISETKTNLKTATSVTTTVPLPVASTTQAGIMNKATYDAVSTNANNINALLNGAVAVSGLSASPSQQDITDAWEAETGLSALINRASVYDVDNDKVWTYYINDATWHAASNTTQVTVNQATNSSLGIVMGSTSDGQAYAENDGTLSVNGWDALTGQVATNTSKLGTIAQGAEANVQSDWAEADSTSDAYIQNKPALAVVATSGSYADLSNIPTVPTITLSTVDIGEGASLAANTLYGVYS